jgi:hypothetical protein
MSRVLGAGDMARMMVAKYKYYRCRCGYRGPALQKLKPTPPSKRIIHEDIKFIDIFKLYFNLLIRYFHT